uniref:Uncharacterized protein n=1 Tax=Rhizophora mucronata TaxID=61149 RepID=A0A2P2KDZ9_RHIMU
MLQFVKKKGARITNHYPRRKLENLHQ